MAENIKVAVRVRPFNQREKDLGSTCVVAVDGSTTSVKGKPFTYDFSYWSHDNSQTFATQDIIWNDIGEVILKNALTGFNGCLFAYGQTGAGKTYSVLGAPSPDLSGIIPRCITRVFEEKASVEQDETVQIYVWVSYLEIYQEHIHDLLCPKQDNVDLTVMQHPKFGVYVPNLTEEACEAAAKVEELMEFGTKRRAIAATQMNATSSRSHSVFCIKVERLDGARPEPGVQDTRHALKAKINLVDLAGSERQSKTGAEGSTLKEGCAINKSLSALGLVIKDLSEAHGKSKEGEDISDRVAFRASKLTFLLKDSLAGNSKTYMIAAISPSSDNVEETLSTLRFASSVKAIKTVAKQNKDKKDALIDSLREELELLRKGGGASSPADAAEIQERERLLEETKKGYEHQIEEAKALEHLRKSAIDHGALSQGDMNKMLGVEENTPYLLNMAEDSTTAGKLLFYLPVTKCTSIGSSDDCDIRFSGVGVSALLCQIENADNHSLKISKCGVDGRVVHDGRVLKAGESRDLKHGQCLFLGRAIALKAVVPVMALEELAAHELLLPELDEEWAAIDASPAMEKVEGFLHQVSQEMSPENTIDFVRRVKAVALLCDEANEITSHLRPSEGISFDVTLTSGKPPHIVVHASRNTDEKGYELIFLCTGEQFRQRLEKMREVHFVFEKRKEVHVEAIHNPWEEVNHDEIHHVVHQLRAKVEVLGGSMPLIQTVHLNGRRSEVSSKRPSSAMQGYDLAVPDDSSDDSIEDVPDPRETAAVIAEDTSQGPVLLAVGSPVHIIDLTESQSNGGDSRPYRSLPNTPARQLSSLPNTPLATSRYSSSTRFVLAARPVVSPQIRRGLVGSPGPSRRCRGRSVDRSMSPGFASSSALAFTPQSRSGSLQVLQGGSVRFRSQSLQRTGPMMVQSPRFQSPAPGSTSSLLGSTSSLAPALSLFPPLNGSSVTALLPTTERALPVKPAAQVDLGVTVSVAAGNSTGVIRPTQPSTPTRADLGVTVSIPSSLGGAKPTTPSRVGKVGHIERPRAATVIDPSVQRQPAKQAVPVIFLQ